MWSVVVNTEEVPITSVCPHSHSRHFSQIVVAVVVVVVFLVVAVAKTFKQ